MLLCYYYHNGIIDEEKNIICVIKPKLFSIGTISLLEIIQYVKTTCGYHGYRSEDQYFKANLKYKAQKKKIIRNRYEPKVVSKDKVYSETYYSH